MPAELPTTGSARASRAAWPWKQTKPWTVNYLAWDHVTARQAIVVLPRAWGPKHHPHPLPLVISPHGRNNFALNNARGYWQNLPAAGPFALVCPDGLARAHSAQTTHVDLPPNPSLFTYGNVGHVHDLARMPQIVEATLPWLELRRDRIYVLGSSMGGQETLLLAARYSKALAGGHGKLAGAAAFDAPCALAVQCGYLTHHRPGVAANMIEEVGTRPASVRGWNLDARYFNRKARGQRTIGSLLAAAAEGPGGVERAQRPQLHAQARFTAVSAAAVLEHRGRRRRQPGTRPDGEAVRGDRGARAARERRRRSAVGGRTRTSSSPASSSARRSPRSGSSRRSDVSSRSSGSSPA